MTKIAEHSRVEIVVPGETHALSLIRKIVTHIAADHGFPEEEVDKIEIAVDEACTNVMEHAYRAETPKPSVRLAIEMNPNEIVVDIIDTGETFDYANYTPPTFPEHWDEGNIRGVGLYLIQQCMDETIYEKVDEEQNRLRLVKRLAQ